MCSARYLDHYLIHIPFTSLKILLEIAGDDLSSHADAHLHLLPMYHSHHGASVIVWRDESHYLPDGIGMGQAGLIALIQALQK